MEHEFVSAVSHELRTPLTAIRGALELLATGEAGDLPTDAQPVVAIASRGSQRLLRLVNDIIDRERLESGTFGIHTAPPDLSPLLLDATESLSPLARGAGTLVGNTLKFTAPRGSVTLSTRASNGSAQVSVRDTGRRIPLSELSAIFDRFHQVDPDDARQNAGTGLGLAITQRIVHAHGWTIGAESTSGAGPTFHLTLPLDASRTLPGVPLAEARSASPPRSPSPPEATDGDVVRGGGGRRVGAHETAATDAKLRAGSGGFTRALVKPPPPPHLTPPGGSPPPRAGRRGRSWGGRSGP